MLLVDTADHEEIVHALKYSAVQGFTTNPNLIARAANVESMSQDAYIDKALGLCRLACDQKARPVGTVMIQGVGSAQHIVKQSEIYAKEMTASPTSKLWIKLLPTPSALNCCAPIRQLGCSTLVTGIYTAAQAYLAMESGADGIAVYIGRMMRLEEAGWQKQLEKIRHVVKEAGKILLLASFRDTATVDAALDFSRDLTVPSKILHEIFESPHSAAAIKDFENKIA